MQPSVALHMLLREVCVTTVGRGLTALPAIAAGGRQEEIEEDDLSGPDFSLLTENACGWHRKCHLADWESKATNTCGALPAPLK